MYLDYIFSDYSFFVLLNKFALLLKINAQNGNITASHYLGDKSRQGFFNRALDCGERILYIPSHSKEFVLVEKTDLHANHIPIPNIEISINNHSFFGDGFTYNNSAYAIGLSYPGILKYDLLSERLTQIADFSNYNCAGLSPDNCRVGNCVYIPAVGIGTIFEFNYLTESFDVHQVSDNDSIWYKTIAFDGEQFILISNENRAYLFDKEFKCYECLYNLDKLIYGKDTVRSILFRGYLYFFFLKGNQILKYSLVNSDYAWIEVPHQNDGLRAVYYAILLETGPAFYSESNDCFFEITEEGGLRANDIISKCGCMREILKMASPMTETPVYGLNEFITNL